MIFSSTLILKINEVSGGEFPLSLKDGVLLLALVNFIASLLAALPSKYIGRKPILATGHALMALCHLLIGVFMVTE
jgi:hypothetical protein